MSPSIPAFIDTDTLQSSSSLLESAVYPIYAAFIDISGHDVIKFLQGQFSCDVEKINTKLSSIGTHNNAKGRMQSSFRIFSSQEQQFTLRLHPSIQESAYAQLHKYAIFSKVKLEVNHDLFAIGLHGKQAAQYLGEFFPDLPTQDFQQCIGHDCVLICTSAALHSYEIYGLNDALKNLWQALSEKLPNCTSQQHQLVEHHLGLAFVQAETVDAFIPQMFNYQNTPAISFDKGCYTGQEIVARLHYLGNNKRQLYRAAIQAQQLQVGDKLGLSSDRQNSGQIVSLVQLTEQQWDALLVLTEEAANIEQAYIGEQAIQLQVYS